MSSMSRRLAAVLLAATLACAESPLEPGQVHELPAIVPRFVLPPGLTPGSFGVVIDSMSLQIVVEDSICDECSIDTVMVDTAMAWPATSEGLRLRVVLPDPPPAKVYWLSMNLYQNGVPMFSGGTTINYHRGTFTLAPIPLFFSGPGYGAEDIQLAPGDTALAPGDTLQFVATAYAAGLPMDTAYVSWRVSDEQHARIDHRGRLTLLPGAQGTTFVVSGTVPNAAFSTVRVSVPNPVVALQRVAGDDQMVPSGTRPPVPLAVRAVDLLGRPVAGARIRFIPISGPGLNIPDSVVFTGPDGVARSAPIPTAPGLDSVRAAVTNSALSVRFAITGAPPVSLPFLFTGGNGLSSWFLYRADSLGGNRVAIQTLGAVGQQWTAPRWNPARSRIVYTRHNDATGNFDLALTTPVGDTTAFLVTDAYASDGRFSPDGTILAFICGALATDLTTGHVCTVTGANAALNTLGGTGNGTGRTEVTAGIPGRPTGPSGFAWRPGTGHRITFARDSILDPSTVVTASRIYESDPDGTGVLPLSPAVLDLGEGPLQILGAMEWSPDGRQLVFTAKVLFGQTSLYLMDGATHAIRRLTTPPPNEFGDLYPRFSPDGTQILFQRVGGYSSFSMYLDYFIVKATGGGAYRLTYEAGGWNGGDPHDLGGDWSPDGNSVVIAAPNGLGEPGAFRVPLDVTGQADYRTRRLFVGTATGGFLTDLGPSWQP